MWRRRWATGSSGCNPTETTGCQDRNGGRNECRSMSDARKLHGHAHFCQRCCKLCSRGLRHLAGNILNFRLCQGRLRVTQADRATWPVDRPLIACRVSYCPQSSKARGPSRPGARVGVTRGKVRVGGGDHVGPGAGVALEAADGGVAGAGEQGRGVGAGLGLDSRTPARRDRRPRQPQRPSILAV